MDWFIYDNGLLHKRVKCCLIHLLVIILRHFLYLLILSYFILILYLFYFILILYLFVTMSRTGFIYVASM